MEELNYAEMGWRIRILREKAGYSRERFSEMANIGPKFLYELESGKKGMSVYTLHNISKALNVTYDYILTGKSENKNLDYIISVLSTFDNDKLAHMEQIVRHIAEMV